MTPNELDSRATITVDEAAELLGISRGSAYEAARRYLASDGTAGVPAVRIGRRIVVPVARFQAFLGASAR